MRLYGAGALKIKMQEPTTPQSEQSGQQSQKRPTAQNVVLSRLITLKKELEHQDNMLLARYVQDTMNYFRQPTTSDFEILTKKG